MGLFSNYTRIKCDLQMVLKDAADPDLLLHRTTPAAGSSRVYTAHK